MGLFRRTKNTNKPLLPQIIGLCPRWMLTRCAEEQNGDKGCSGYKSMTLLLTATR